MELNDLSYLELHILLEHLRLGLDHLKKYLEPEQLNKLLSNGRLDQAQKETIAADTAEKAGNLALVINTIITSVFGAWMGLSGFIGLNLGSVVALLIVVVIAALISGTIGYHSFVLVKAQAKQAMQQQRLNNLQIKVLQLIQEKRKQSVEKVIAYINQTANQINQSFASEQGHYLRETCFDKKNEILEWLQSLKKLIDAKIRQHRDVEIFQIYIHDLKVAVQKLRRMLAKNLEITEDFTEKSASNKQQTNGSFIKVLTNPTLITPKKTPVKHTWWRVNLRAITVGLAPTLLGGFASMFVFLGGGPSISNALKLYQLEALLTSMPAKLVEFFIAVCLTIYFGYSHIHTNRKSFERRQELEHAEKQIVNFEKTLIEYNAKLNMLMKVKRSFRRIKDNFIVMTKLKYFLEHEQEKLKEYAQAVNKLETVLEKAGVKIDAHGGVILRKVRDYQNATKNKTTSD